MQTSHQPVFSVFADSRTGNRGAVSMLESAIDYLTTAEHPGRVNVFTVYPKADKKLPSTPNVYLYNGTPAKLAFKLTPLSMLYRLTQVLRIKTKPESWGVAMQALLETDACLMIGGTTFTDAKPFKILYNVFCLLPAIILKKKSMMYSQTLGPFNTPFNRILAHWCLSKMDFIVPRGAGSLKNVEMLNPGRPFANFADSAFTLHIPAEVDKAIHAKYDKTLAGKKVVGISINTIVQEECEKLGIDHHGAWVKFIEHLLGKGYFILMIPHSIRKGSKKSHNNDLMAVSEIISRLSSTQNVLVVDDDYNCKELRVVVGLADYYVASRFHSMISALCTGVPVSVFGWGFQKYREVLADFELEEYCHDAAELSADELIKGFEKIVSDEKKIKAKIKEHLPAVQASSRKNHETAWKLAQE
jgi:polysaccharide pyruvyl transferase WcaK-like protein